MIAGNIIVKEVIATTANISGTLKTVGDTTLGNLIAGNITISGTLKTVGETTLGNVNAGNITISGSVAGKELNATTFKVTGITMELQCYFKLFLLF